MTKAELLEQIERTLADVADDVDFDLVVTDCDQDSYEISAQTMGEDGIGWQIPLFWPGVN